MPVAVRRPPVPEKAREFIGRQGFLKLEGFEIAVQVLDVRNRYGNVDALVRPEGGHDERWIKMSRIRLI